MFVFLILEDVLRYKWKILPSTVAIYSWMSLLHSPWTNNIESILEVIIAKALKILYLGKYFPCRLLLNMFFLQITWSFNLLFLNKEDHLCILWSWTFFQFCRNVPGNITDSFSRAWYSMTLVGYEANEKYMFCPIFNIAVQGWFFQFWIRGKIIVGQWFHLILRIRANTPRSSWDGQTMWLVHINMIIYWHPQIQFCTCRSVV